MNYGSLFKDAEGWWFCCPEYETYGCTFDACGPYPTKAEAQAAWTSLARSYRKHDKTYGRDDRECTGSSRPIRGEWSEASEGEGHEPDPASHARRTGKRRKRRDRPSKGQGRVGSAGTEDEPNGPGPVGCSSGVLDQHTVESGGDRGRADADGSDVLPGPDLGRTTDLSSVIGDAFSFL
jgi:hypothetical protein